MYLQALDRITLLGKIYSQEMIVVLDWFGVRVLGFGFGFGIGFGLGLVYLKRLCQ